MLNGVDATWLDDADKAAMAAEFAAEFDRYAEQPEPGELPAWCGGGEGVRPGARGDPGVRSRDRSG